MERRLGPIGPSRSAYGQACLDRGPGATPSGSFF